MNKTIKIDYITKIEGHAKLYIKVDKGIVKDVKLEVVEGARFFEGMLLGKRYDEVPIITSRICGVCPQAHSIASIGAIEKAFGIKVTKQTELIREMLLIGQIIKSHTLHLYFMALPDYFGKKSILEMAKDHRELINLGMKLKSVGNRLTDSIGGREIHSISNIVGGFSKLPSKEELKELKKFLESNLKAGLEGVKLFAGFGIPNYTKDTQYLHLTDKKGSSLFGDVICSDKICKDIEYYKDLMHEYVETYSSAKHVTIDNDSFFVGSLARMNHKEFSDDISKILKKEGIVFPSKNPYHNNLAQCIEVYELMKRAIDILGILLSNEIKQKNTEIIPKKSSATFAIEAPRGILFHEYSFDKNGYVTKANIITPTTQNLKNLEEDIKKILPDLLDKDEKIIILEIEKLIRAYDPCISCSTHFLKVTWDKS